MGCEWGYFKGPPRIKSPYVTMLTPCLTGWWLHHIAVIVAHIQRKLTWTGWFLKLKILHGKFHQPQFWNNIDQMKTLTELISSFCLLTGLTWMFNWTISWTGWKTRRLFSRKDRAHSDSTDIQLYLGWHPCRVTPSLPLYETLIVLSTSTQQCYTCAAKAK